MAGLSRLLVLDGHLGSPLASTTEVREIRESNRNVELFPSNSREVLDGAE
jgi:hypothetical protein